jgi:hypothetical protein
MEEVNKIFLLYHGHLNLKLKNLRTYNDRYTVETVVQDCHPH